MFYYIGIFLRRFESMIKLNNKTYTCPIDVTLGFIGGKWKILILSHIDRYKKRSFSEIKKNLPGVSEKMLSQQLRELERDKLIVKKVLSEKPFRVEHSLDSNGKKLSSLFEAASKWGVRYLKQNGIDYIKDQALYK